MKTKLTYIVCGLTLVLPAAVSAHAMDTDDAKLETEAQRTDSDKPAATDTQKVKELAKQFHVSPDTIQDLRRQGQGWGEIAIGLSMAQRLEKTDPAMFPTMADALNKVETLRSSGEGWGKIAKNLGFKLGPVVREAHHVRHELHETTRHERIELARHEEMGEHEGVHHERMEHPLEHPERPDRPGH